MPRINIPELKIFIAAAEEKNFSRAAERLNLSQSAISQNIQAIEKTYGVPLFVRRGRNVELSEAGQTVLPAAREVLNAARLFEDTLLNINQDVGGELVIGCSTSAGRYLMPTLLSLFQQEYPSVRSRVRVMSRDSVLERVLGESLPIGVTSRRFEHRELESAALFDDPIVLIVHPVHPWASYGRAMPADLIDQPIIMREESSGTVGAISEGLKEHSITLDMLHTTMELGAAEAIEMAVERGMGIAFVSEMVAARGLAMGRICKVEVEGLHLNRTVWMSRRVGYPFTRAQSLFWQFAQGMRERIKTDIWQSLTDFAPVA
jgi:DNA-binding transcriptional LysR family regulator